MITSSLNSALDIGAGALQAYSGKVNAAAHNIANVSTEGFSPISGRLADGPGGVGTFLSAIVRDGVPLDGDASQGAPRPGEPSGTDLARELTSLTLDQRAFQANVKIIAAVDEMMGALLDSKI